MTRGAGIQSLKDEHPETQMLHVWNIYLQNWVILVVNVGKYSVHGAYGRKNLVLNVLLNLLNHGESNFLNMFAEKGFGKYVLREDTFLVTI